MSVPTLTQAQTNPSFKDDTTALSQQLIREKFKTKIAAEQKSQADIKKQQEETPEKTDPNEQLKTDLERLSLLQKALVSPSVSALSGNITISEGTSSLAETRALAYQALDTLLARFITDMKVSTTATVASTTIACAGMPCSETATILIYNPTYFEALPDYQALINELNLPAAKGESREFRC